MTWHVWIHILSPLPWILDCRTTILHPCIPILALHGMKKFLHNVDNGCADWSLTWSTSVKSENSSTVTRNRHLRPPSTSSHKSMSTDCHARSGTWCDIISSFWLAAEYFRQISQPLTLSEISLEIPGQNTESRAKFNVYLIPKWALCSCWNHNSLASLSDHLDTLIRPWTEDNVWPQDQLTWYYLASHCQCTKLPFSVPGLQQLPSWLLLNSYQWCAP